MWPVRSPFKGALVDSGSEGRLKNECDTMVDIIEGLEGPESWKVIYDDCIPKGPRLLLEPSVAPKH